MRQSEKGIGMQAQPATGLLGKGRSSYKGRSRVPCTVIIYHMKTQSDTQWDGFRHFGAYAHGFVLHQHERLGHSGSEREPEVQYPSLHKFVRLQIKEP